MDKIVILYGSSEGQTAKIAQHIAEVIREKCYVVDVMDCRTLPVNFSLAFYETVIIGASLHASGYQKCVRTFIQQQLGELEQIPNAFFSVSLTEASSHPEEKVQLQQLMTTFLQQIGWRPQLVMSFAGALAYSKYGFLKRIVMQNIARRAGAPTDPSHDYEYTDWEAVTRFAEHFLAMLQPVQEAHALGS